jgi:hypothetical protein
MLALVRALRRAIRTGDKQAVGLAYFNLSERIGREKTMAPAHHFWRR